MQKGFEGNKTQMIEMAAKQYAARLECVTISDLQSLIDRIDSYEKDNDVYNADLNRCRLNHVIERAAKEGVK